MLADINAEYNEIQPVLAALADLDIGKSFNLNNSSNIFVTYPAKQTLRVDSSHAFFNEISANIARAVYIHIPFCTGICSYCGFARTAKAATSPVIEIYLACLRKEILQVKALLGSHKIQASSIYIGGGTPTLLNEESLANLLAFIQANIALAEGGEYTLEASPETITLDKIRLARALGVNRVSMGVESFNDDILKQIKRRHDSAMVYDVTELIRKGGIDNIDLDLIRGLPNYTQALLEQDVMAIAQLGVPSVTSYQFIVKDKTIDKKKQQHQQLTLASKEECLLQHLVFIKAMANIGFTHGEPLLDCFVRAPEFAYQHNVEKWLQNKELLGFGQGAYGYLNNTQYINHENQRAYMDGIRQHGIAVSKQITLTAQESLKREIIFNLKGCVPVKKVARYAEFARDGFYQSLQQLIHLGAISAHGETYRLAPGANLVADWLMVHLGQQ